LTADPTGSLHINLGALGELIQGEEAPGWRAAAFPAGPGPWTVSPWKRGGLFYPHGPGNPGGPGPGRGFGIPAVGRGALRFPDLGPRYGPSAQRRGRGLFSPLGPGVPGRRAVPVEPEGGITFVVMRKSLEKEFIGG
jgi:hypothetical protein